MTSYRTTELELASFLKASGHRLMGATQQGRLVSFAFEPSAASHAEAYIAGAQMPARDLFAAHRALRALIQQVKEHSKQNTGTDHNYEDYSR